MATYWQYNEHGILNRIKYILDNELNCDCEFLVGREKKSFKAHKLIVSIASPVFEKMFYGEFQSDIIEIEDVESNAFQSFLRFIYTDKFEIEDFTQGLNLYYIAEKYMLRPLVQLCLDHLIANVNESNACQAFEFSKLFVLENLTIASEEIILQRTSNILKDPKFKEIEKETLLMILDQNELAIESELELYEAAIAWANAEFKRAGIELEKKLIDEILSKIRFLTMRPEEFASGPAIDGFLNKGDALAMLIHICSSDTKEKYPEKYTNNRNKRFV